MGLPHWIVQCFLDEHIIIALMLSLALASSGLVFRSVESVNGSVCPRGDARLGHASAMWPQTDNGALCWKRHEAR